MIGSLGELRQFAAARRLADNRPWLEVHTEVEAGPLDQIEASRQVGAADPKRLAGYGMLVNQPTARARYGRLSDVNWQQVVRVGGQALSTLVGPGPQAPSPSPSQPDVPPPSPKIFGLPNYVVYAGGAVAAAGLILFVLSRRRHGAYRGHTGRRHRRARR